MACDCLEYTCVDARFSRCSEGIELDIVAPSDGIFWSEIEFNGRWSKFLLAMVAGEKIIYPTKYLNGHYDHNMKIISGSPATAICYTLKARELGKNSDIQLFTPLPTE